MPNDPTEPGGSWLEDRLTKVAAVYRKFGRDGLREFPLADIRLLLASKELAHRDAPKGADLGEAQKAANRTSELEIADIRGFMQAECGQGAASPLQKFFRGGDRPPFPGRKHRDHDR